MKKQILWHRPFLVFILGFGIASLAHADANGDADIATLQNVSGTIHFKGRVIADTCKLAAAAIESGSAAMEKTVDLGDRSLSTLQMENYADAEEKVFSVYVHGCNLKQVRINFAGVQNEVDSATGYLTTNIDGLLIKLSDASRKPINLNANQNNEFYSLGTNGLMNFHAAYHVVSGMASGLQAGVVKAVVSFNIDYQ